MFTGASVSISRPLPEVEKLVPPFVTVPTFWYAKISILWNIPLPVRIAAKRFRWCWTYPCTSKLMWKIAKCAATPLKSVTPCRTKSWWNFRPGLWDDCKLECQRIATIQVGGAMMSIGFNSEEIILEKLRGRSRRMTDEELIEFGENARKLAENPFQRQLRRDGSGSGEKSGQF
jgi:hypothetical protein